MPFSSTWDEDLTPSFQYMVEVAYLGQICSKFGVLVTYLHEDSLKFEFASWIF